MYLLFNNLIQNIHNFVQFKRFTIINPFPLTQSTSKEAKINKKQTLNHNNNINNIN